MKKALIVVPSLKVGDGISRVMMNYHHRLIADGWQVDFMTVFTPVGAWAEQVRQWGSRIITLPQKSKFSLEVRRAVQKIIGEGKYDIVHTNFAGQVSYVVAAAAKKNGGKVIYHCHNPLDISNIKSVFSNRLYDRLMMKRADCLMACSAHAGNSRFCGRPYVLLKNTIDPVKFSFNEEARREIRGQHHLADKTVIGVVARMTKQKNPDFILRCFAEILQRNSRAHLVWIGFGDMETQVKEQAQKLGIGEHCLFAGKQENVEAWYSAMDGFLMPSLFEGFGFAALEAQCAGLPCFVSEAVPAEVDVSSRIHRLSLNQSPADWADGMVLALEHPAERKGSEESVIKAGFSSRHQDGALCEVYNGLIGYSGERK